MLCLGGQCILGGYFNFLVPTCVSFILLPTVMGFAGALSAVVFGGIGGGEG